MSEAFHQQVKETEMSVFDEIITSNIYVDEVKSLGLTAEDFNSETHRLIFEAMERLHDRSAPVDVLTLSTELENTQKERPDGGGWVSYITRVIDLAVPIGDVAYHVGVIKEAALLRRLKDAGDKLSEAAKEGDVEGAKIWSERVAEIRTQGEVDTRARCIILAHCNPEPVTWLIDGLISEEFPSYLYAREGLGKSFVAALLATEVCRGGGSFMGHSYRGKPANVLYVDYELSSGVHVERGEKIARGLNLPGIPENLFYCNPEAPIMEALPEIKKLIDQHDIGLVIVDAWQSAGLDSYDPAVAADYFSAMRSLGAASLTVDHEKKSQGGIDSGGDSFYGSVHKRTQVRSAFRLTRIGDGKNPMTLRLSQTKNSFGVLAEDMAFDVCFEGDRVLFTQSSAPNPDERDFELIGEAIATLGAGRARVNQQALTEHLKGVIAKNRLHDLLKKGGGNRWQVTRGERNEMLYESSFPVSRTISTRETGKLEIGNNDGLPQPPDELY